MTLNDQEVALVNRFIDNANKKGLNQFLFDTGWHGQTKLIIGKEPDEVAAIAIINEGDGENSIASVNVNRDTEVAEVKLKTNTHVFSLADAEIIARGKYFSKLNLSKAKEQYRPLLKQLIDIVFRIMQGVEKENES